MRTGPQFSFDIGTTTVANDEIRILYTKRQPSGRLFVQGAACDRNLTGCHVVAGWNSTNFQGDQFNPNVKTFPGFLPWYGQDVQSTYLSRENNASGNSVSVQAAMLTYSGVTPLFAKSQLEADQIPCSGNGGYWSDYDDLELAWVDMGTGIHFIHSFPDSTASACNAPLTKPIHSSAVKFQ